MSNSNPAAGGAKRKGTTRGKTKPKSPSNKIKFSATVGNIKSGARGAVVGFLVPLSHMEQVAALMQSKMPDLILEVTAIVKQVKNAKEKNNKGRSKQRRRWNNTYRAK